MKTGILCSVSLFSTVVVSCSEKQKLPKATTSVHRGISWPQFANWQIEAPQNDGISFVPELLGKKQKEHEYLYWEFPNASGLKAIRMRKWKGLILDFRQNRESNMMLFNLETDPREQNNVASEYPDIIKTMRENMDKAHEEPVVSKFSL